MQHAELRCKGGVGSKVGWSKALNKTVDYRVDSQVKVGMRERGFKEEGIREEMETEGGGGSQGQEGQAEREHSTRQRAVVGRGTSWSAVGRGASWHKTGSMVGRTRGREMGRAPWLEEFASRWAARWVESQLPRPLSRRSPLASCSCTPCEAMLVRGTHTARELRPSVSEVVNQSCHSLHDLAPL